MKLVVSPAALADIERLHAFLSPNCPSAASRAAKVLIDAVQSLAVLPERGRPSGTPHMRELIIPFGRSAYVLRYSYSDEADESSCIISGTAARRGNDSFKAGKAQRASIAPHGFDRGADRPRSASS